jgi:hypothetical protein
MARTSSHFLGIEAITALASKMPASHIFPTVQALVYSLSQTAMGLKIWFARSDTAFAGMF